MPDLDLDTLLEHLACELGEMPVETLTWLRPFLSLGRRTHPQLSRAVERLDGPGLLAVRVSGGVRGAVDAGEACEQLQAELGDLGAEVEAVHPATVTDGLVVLVQLAGPAPVLPELLPLSDAAIGDLDRDLVARLAGHAPRVEPDHDAEWSRAERALMRLGAAVEEEGEVVPTVAGMVALGRAPSRYLSGMRAIVHGDEEIAVTGTIEVLPQRVVRALRVPEPAAVGLRSLVIHALACRNWAAEARGEPLVVLGDGRRVEVRWPEALEARNERLHELLRLRRIDSRALDVRGLRRWFQRRGGRGPVFKRKDGELRAGVVLPPVGPVGRGRRSRAPRAEGKQAVDRLGERRAPAAAVSRPLGDAGSVPPSPAPFVPAAEREAEVLALADARRSITTRDVIETLGWTRSTTRDVLARLVREGSLRRVAASVRSPIQAYELA